MTCTAGAYASGLGSKPGMVRWFISWKRVRSHTEKSKKVCAYSCSAPRMSGGQRASMAIITSRHSVHAWANIAS